MSKYQVKVPEYYNPNVTISFFKPRSCWRYRCLLPSNEKIEFIGYTPKGTIKTEKQAKRFRDFKHDELKKGALNEKEYNKLLKNNLEEDYSFESALLKYIELTKITKTPQTIKKEKDLFPEIFSYFKNHHQMTHLKQVKQKHLQEYKEYLLNMAALRKEKVDKLTPLLKLESTTDEDRRRLTREIRSTGLAPSTAQSYFAMIRKLFNKLYHEQKIVFNPTEKVSTISISTSDAARSKTFEPLHISKIASSDYKHQEGFPLVLFVLFLAETGARKGEALHFEWPDFNLKTRVWTIEEKKNCPTRFKVGWKPKWNKKRKIYLSDTAMKILNMIPKVESVGYVRTEIKGKNKNGTTEYKKEAVKANFVFTVRDETSGLHRRVDDIKRSWKSLLKKAGIGQIGFDQFVLHDFRRYKNVINECVYNMSLKQRSEELGNSERVNSMHYSGEISDDLLKFQSQIQELTAKNLELQAKLEALENVS